MRVVFSPFFNEAYMLPWWLRHHREMFDHGVLVDWNSTDGSAEICRELVPGWEVVRTENTEFAALLVDFELMKHEQRFADAWKIVLNATEFLVAPELSLIEDQMQAADSTGYRMPAAIMVDTAPEQTADPARPLVQQKDCGIWEDAPADALQNLLRSVAPRGRLYHRYPIGAYTPGRHQSMLPQASIYPTGDRQHGAIWWYGFSPWTEAFKMRKQQIGARRGEFDVKNRFGAQHGWDIAEMEARWQALRAESGSLWPSLDSPQPPTSPRPDKSSK